MNIQELIQRRQELKIELRDIDDQLTNEVMNMPQEIIYAWQAGIIRFNFPLPTWLRRELIDRITR